LSKGREGEGPILLDDSLVLVLLLKLISHSTLGLVLAHYSSQNNFLMYLESLLIAVKQELSANPLQLLLLHLLHLILETMISFL